MALTFSNNNAFPPMKGGWRLGTVDVTFDNSYPTGGEAVTAANLNLNTLVLLQPSNLEGFMLHWDEANGTIEAYESGTADAALGELNNASAALDGLISRCFYVGY